MGSQLALPFDYKEYAAARHKPRKGEEQCEAESNMAREHGRIIHRVRCDWIKGHPGPHNQFKGDWVW